MKVGIELNVDVTKIEKQRLYQGQKGKYLTMTAFVDLDVVDQYGNNGMITHKKNEGEDRAPILGNSKVFWTDAPQGQQQAPQQQSQQPSQQLAQKRQQAQQSQGGFQQQGQQQKVNPQEHDMNFDDDIPF